MTGYRHGLSFHLHEADANHIRGLSRGETRTIPAGRPVGWVLALTSPDFYRWKQAGAWRLLGYTGSIQRCPPRDRQSAGGALEPVIRPGI